MSKKIQEPSARDLEIWNKVSSDLIDWLYSGITGKFQIRGHQTLGKWSKNFQDKRILEIGCGHGHHLSYGNQSYTNYIGLDIVYPYLTTLQSRYKTTSVINGDAYWLPFADNSMDAILSVYNLEHLKALDDGLDEINRVLKREGELFIGLPAEGGLIYGLGRHFTSKPYMEKKYGIDYDAIVHYEHCNTYRSIVKKLNEKFYLKRKEYIPFSFFPSVHCNAIICISAIKR